MITCPRCESQKAEVVAQSPVAGKWEIYNCPVCQFTWRSTEPESITKPDLYDKAFKVNSAEIPNATQVPIIPPLKR